MLQEPIYIPVELVEVILSFLLSNLIDNSPVKSSLRFVSHCFHEITWSFTSRVREIEMPNILILSSLRFTRHITHLQLVFPYSNLPSFPQWINEFHSPLIAFFK